MKVNFLVATEDGWSDRSNKAKRWDILTFFERFYLFSARVPKAPSPRFGTFLNSVQQY